jgi:hypothetical protein
MSNTSWLAVAIAVIVGEALAMFGDVLFAQEAIVLSKQGLDLFGQFVC